MAPALIAVKDLAARINGQHAECLSCLRSGLEHARRAGELLLQAKEQVGHGEWLPWLGENFKGERRTAQGYMRISDHWDELSNTQTSAYLSVDAALKLLASPSESDKPLPADQLLPPVIPDDPPKPQVMSKDEYEAAVDPPPSITPEQQAAEAREIAQAGWGKVFYRLYVTCNSVRDAGGAKALMGGWSRAAKKAVVDDIDNITSILSEWRKDLAKG